MFGKRRGRPVQSAMILFKNFPGNPAKFSDSGLQIASDKCLGGIDMPQGSGNNNDGSGVSVGVSDEKRVIDFNEVRAQKLDEKRRTTERIFFKHLLNVYSVLGHTTMFPIEFIDISEDGCSFQIPYDTEKPWPTDTTELPLRIYFSQDTYLEIRVNILNSRPSIENNRRYVRYGCKIDNATASYAAYQQFVKFLRSYSEHAHKDLGDVSVFYL
jgi:hypothetical protein